MTLKPFIYGPAYINGILFAFLIENDHYYRQLRTNPMFNNVTRIGKWLTLLASLVIAPGRNILYRGLPLFSAIETSLYPSAWSFIFFFLIFEYGRVFMFRATMSRFWSLFRRITKISYLMNPVMFLIFTGLPFESGLNRLLVCILSHLLLCTGLTLAFEIPIYKVLYMTTKNFLYN